MTTPLTRARRFRRSIGVVAGAVLWIQGCTTRPSAQAPPRAKPFSAAARTIPLADGGRVSVERTASLEGEGERVVVFDQQGQQVSLSWCAESTGNYDRLASLFRQLQKAVAANDRLAVARLTRFPLQVNGGAGERIDSAGTLLQRYGQVFTPAVTQAIIQSAPQAVFCTAEAATASDGAVWASTRDGRTAIDVVNR